MHAPWFVVAWMHWTIGAALLLLIARLAFTATASIAERARIVQLALLAALALPAWTLLTPIPAWRWPLLAAVGDDATNVVDAALENPRLADGGFASNGLAGGRPRTLNEANEAAAHSTHQSVSHNAGAGAGPHEDSGAGLSLLNLPARLASQMSQALSDPWSLGAMLIAVVHLGAAVFFTLEWLIGRRRLNRLIAESSPAIGELAALWNDVGGRRASTVRVVTSNAVQTPLVCRGVRPVIVLPETLAHGDRATLRYCLRHELAHLEHGDLFWASLLWWARLWLWPQPLFWRLQRELKLCQELAADARAAGAGDEVEYAELLLSLARSRALPTRVGALDFVDRSSQLTRRVAMLLNPSSAASRRCSKLFSLAVAGAALTATVVLGVRIDLVHAQAPPAPPAAPANAAAPLKYTGVVSDESGEPIVGAIVTVRRSILTNKTNNVLLETRHTTDAKGQYAFEISPEHAAERMLYIELDAEARGFASRMGFGYALGMILRNEKFGGRPFFEQVKLARGKAITGKVLDSKGQPRAGVFVQGFSMRERDFNNASFSKTRTDESGAFRLEFFARADGCLWVVPKDEAIVGRLVTADASGDLGEIRTTPGVRVQGRLLDGEGNPLAGKPIAIRLAQQDPVAGSLPVASSTQRGALTDGEGRFELGPMAPGQYQLNPTDTLNDPLSDDETRYEIPGVYAPVKVELKADVSPAAIELRPSPQTTLRMQAFDSAGKKAGAHEFWVSGEWNGEYWTGIGRPDAEGSATVNLPLGLKEARVSLITNEHSVLNARLGADKPWTKDVHFLPIESVGPDMPTLEVVRYRSPVLAVNVVDEQKQPIKGAKVVGHYSKNDDPNPEIALMGSDVQFEEQTNGWRRTSSMLPNEDVFLIIGAEGYETKREVVNLPEGENRELTITLVKKAAEAK